MLAPVHPGPFIRRYAVGGASNTDSSTDDYKGMSVEPSYANPSADDDTGGYMEMPAPMGGQEEGGYMDVDAAGDDDDY